MRIAVPYENGSVCGTFTDTDAFKLYDAVSGKVAFSQVVSTSGKSPAALAGFLADQLVTCLICADISDAGKEALEEWGIQLFAGCAGDADRRVDELLAGTLNATFSTARSAHHL